MKFKRKGIVILTLVIAIGIALMVYVVANNGQSYGENEQSGLSDKTQETTIEKTVGNENDDADKADKKLLQGSSDQVQEKTRTDNNANSSGKSSKTPDSANQSEAKNNSNAGTKDSKPNHVHVWTPVYSERQVAHYTQEEHEICNVCGMDLTGLSDDAFYAHFENGTCGGFHSKWVTKTTYTMEKYISHYQCSCGATKK